LQPAGAEQSASAGAQQLGSAGAEQLASAGAQQLASAGALQLGSLLHPSPQPLSLLKMFLILENSPPIFDTEQPSSQPSSPQAAGAQQVGSAGAQQLASAGAQQVGSTHSAGAEQSASAGAQQDGSSEQLSLLCPNRSKRPAFAVLLIVKTTIAAVRVIPRIVSILLNMEHEDEEDQRVRSAFSTRNWVTLKFLFGPTRMSDTCKRQ
jgi:hypothetical protein